MTTTHAPAVKVGGRRLSLTYRSKPSAPVAAPVPVDQPSEESSSSPVDDYPRPTSHAHQERSHHHLDYAPYDEAHKSKAAEAHSSHVAKSGEVVVSGAHEPLMKKEVVRGSRIVQPAGKGLGL